MKGFEIERKFLMADNCRVTGKLIYDGISIQRYLSINPEIRIRKNINNFTGEESYEMTIKGSGGLKRKEVNIPIEKCHYDILKNFVNGTPTVKFYKNYELCGNKILTVSSVDVDLPQHFVYGEIEFDNEKDANAYNITEFDYIKEITDDQTYKMKNYWLHYHYTGE